jgi:hypothetical protein
MVKNEFLIKNLLTTNYSRQIWQNVKKAAREGGR